MVNFLVVRAKSAYNAILGRPSQNLLRAIPSAYHQKMKFTTPGGIGEVRGDQPQSRQCYAAALRGESASESLPIELFDLRDEAQIIVNEPAEDLLSVPSYSDDDQRDSYPLLKIDQLIDATAGHELLSFMDAFSGYNQIRMHESDIPKTSFVTDQGTYCYRVMPFGLKNAGATYQRLVNRLFNEQIGRNMEVYVDDMLVKSRAACNHVADLKEAFQVLRQHNMKLNPTKCTFSVGAETRYQRVEKLVYALIMAARKLRPYFQAHTIKVLTGQPLRQILHRPDTSGRLVKWAVELGEFDIKYLPRPAIKAQVLADFIAECTTPDADPGSEVAPPLGAEPVIPEPQIGAEAVPLPGLEGAVPQVCPLPYSEEPLWEVYVDGSSNRSGSGAGLVLTGPDDFILNYAVRFGFRASNNEAEYEALIAGMNLAIQARAQRLKAYCDSQLVVCQIQGEYEAREERMVKYLQRVRSLASEFGSFEVIRVPRTENTKADVLSKLAASGYTAL
ncbi:uncharacterized protein LOC143850547 [Tasmannia lanceolata]|uniref:uncharacterized protein LOC143850547 n=1 Tax=Tasmannia lanceolata TaxID=3420 RepID=UPI0040645ABD